MRFHRVFHAHLKQTVLQRLQCRQYYYDTTKTEHASMSALTQKVDYVHLKFVKLINFP